MILGLFKISGHSMLPYLAPGDHVLTSTTPYLIFKPKIGDVVVFRSNNLSIMVKRISKISNGKFFVEGDNKNDSFNPASINKKDIIGKVLFKLSLK